MGAVLGYVIKYTVLVWASCLAPGSYLAGARQLPHTKTVYFITYHSKGYLPANLDTVFLCVIKYTVLVWGSWLAPGSYLKPKQYILSQKVARDTCQLTW